MEVIQTFAYFAFGNKLTNESHPCICGTGHDVEVSVLDFKYRERISNLQTMFPKISKSFKKFFIGDFSEPRFNGTESVL